MSVDSRVQTFCQQCHMKCRLFCTLEDGKITEIANVMGIDGIKAMAAPETVYHPNRVIYPQKRVGNRGSGKWRRISWDEALDTMAEKFGVIRETYGPQANSTIWGCGHKLMASASTFMFSHALGTPNILDINQQCDLPLDIAQVTTFGENVLTDQSPYFKYSKCILIWGSNPRHTRPAMEKDINYAQAHGAKVIKVDPRPPEVLDMDALGLPAADIWLRVRPGTDGALALGMLHVVINEGLHNKNFVDDYCTGFERLKKHVQPYDPKTVSEITWVPQEKIIEAARLFASSEPSCTFARLGVGSQQPNAAQQARAVCILTAIAGNIDVRGGNLLGHGKIGDNVRFFKPEYEPGIEEKRCGFKEFPLFAGSSANVKNFTPPGYAHNQIALQAMMDKKIRGFYIPGCNMVLGEGDSRKTVKALKSLDFIVSADLFMTPTCELSDLVLPAAHWLETEMPMRAYQNMGPRFMNYIMASQKVIEPVGECWDDRKIVIELAKRMGTKLPWSSIEEHNDWLLEHYKIRFEVLKKKRGSAISWPLSFENYKKEGFKTPSGKIELFSSILDTNGYEGLPSHIEPPQSPISDPVLFKEYPLLLSNHRHIVYTHSEFRETTILRGEFPEPEIEVNTDTAKKLGLKAGDEVFIETPKFKERVYMKTKLVSGLHPNVVSCLSHWWFPEKSGPEHGCFESNINTIISTEPPYDPISMNYQMRGLFCRIGKSDRR